MVATTSKQVKLDPHCLRQKCGPNNSFFKRFMVIFAEITENDCVEKKLLKLLPQKTA